MSPELPAPVAAWFAADATRDDDALAQSFAIGAVVKDEGEIHQGREAIRAWWRAAKAKYCYEVVPLEAVAQDGQLIVSGRVTGDFPSSPATVRFKFELGESGIGRLEIEA